MHEMSFAEQIMTSVLEEAGKYADSRVSRVKLRASEMLAIEPASLRFCLEGITQGTAMEGAQIEYEEGGPDLGTALIIEEIELNEQDDSS
jgi:hydrogenase nickel incorporation protein HypA/HybF